MGQPRKIAPRYNEIVLCMRNSQRRLQDKSRNHIHLLISEPAKGTPSTVMQVLKQRVSRRLRRKASKKVPSQQLRLPFRHAYDSLPQFWQPRFYDFNVWSQTKFVEKLQYMHLNPVKRKLVVHPRDWPWSSFSFYAKKESGLVRIDPIR